MASKPRKPKAPNGSSEKKARATPLRSNVPAVIPQKKPEEPEQTKVPEPEAVLVPAELLLAADLVASKADREDLKCVFLHVDDNGRGRVVGIDGPRMFVGSWELPEDRTPSWLKSKPEKHRYSEGGLLLSVEGLRSRVSMIGKAAGVVRITWAEHKPKADLSDLVDDVIFRQPVKSHSFPEYERVLGSDSFVALDPEGAVTGREWEPVGINSKFLKHVGEVAKVLQVALDRNAKPGTKADMVVRTFSANPNSPVVFDFVGYPGSILVIAPTRITNPALPSATAQMLAPAVKLTIAALRAHATRNRTWADETEDEKAKAEFVAKAETFEQRITDLLKKAPGVQAQIGA